MTNKTTKLLFLAKNIKKARKEKNLSQNKLAEILDISREHLAKIETGKRTISLGLLFQLCDALCITEKEVFDFNE